MVNLAFLVDESLGYGFDSEDNDRLYWMTSTFGIRFATNILQPDLTTKSCLSRVVIQLYLQMAAK